MGSAYDELQDKKNQLIRKELDGSVFAAPYSADPITTLTDPVDRLLQPLPEGYFDLGWYSTDGVSMERSVEESAIRSSGSVDPTRTDITADTTTLAVQCQETNLQTIGLYTGAAWEAIQADADSGEVRIRKPRRPASRYYRLLKVSVDLSDDGEIYIARFLPRAKVTNFDPQTFTSEGENAITWPVTLTGFLDSTEGYSEAYLFGGPGWYALLEDMRIPIAGAGS